MEEKIPLLKEPAAVTLALAIILGLSAQATSSVQAADKKIFDAASLTTSDVPLGAFPYIALPDGYVAGPLNVVDFDQVPLWTGDRLEPVQGKIWSAHISSIEGKTFSDLELEHNLEAAISSIGGKKIFDGKLPEEATQKISEWPSDVASRYNSGLGDIWNNPAKVFVVHRADRDIWIHLCSYEFGGGLLVAETKPLKITASLLPASAMKAQIDKAGKVALHINFATDKTDILADSQLQIAQIVQMLKDHPALKLAVNGYTDGVGNLAHNKTLSEGRAKAVVAAITAKGIEAARLLPAGFGDANPVADNTTEAGKAQNRRVELVKQD